VIGVLVNSLIELTQVNRSSTKPSAIKQIRIDPAIGGRLINEFRGEAVKICNVGKTSSALNDQDRYGGFCV
jgi:hypothetical protein